MTKSGTSTKLTRWQLRHNCVCAVCEGRADGKFFGAAVCLPCKSFFIRCTKDGNPCFTCLGSMKCDVRGNNRMHCQYCRYQRCLQVGMARKEKPLVVEPRQGQKQCQVCLDIANGVHFGVLTCEGCKKFFRRAMKEYEIYSCRYDSNCPINPRNRNACRYCRYQKCIRLGMSRTAIKMGRPKKSSDVSEDDLEVTKQSMKLSFQNGANYSTYGAFISRQYTPYKKWLSQCTVPREWRDMTSAYHTNSTSPVSSSSSQQSGVTSMDVSYSDMSHSNKQAGDNTNSMTLYTSSNNHVQPSNAENSYVFTMHDNGQSRRQAAFRHPGSLKQEHRSDCRYTAQQGDQWPIMYRNIISQSVQYDDSENRAFVAIMQPAAQPVQAGSNAHDLGFIEECFEVDPKPLSSDDIQELDDILENGTFDEKNLLQAVTSNYVQPSQVSSSIEYSTSAAVLPQLSGDAASTHRVVDNSRDMYSSAIHNNIQSGINYKVCHYTNDTNYSYGQHSQ